MKKILFLFITLMTVTFAAKAVSVGYFNFEGHVGKYSVAGTIELTDWGTVEGTYYYNGHSNYLSLSGTWKSLGSGKYKLTMTEYDTRGQKSGSWSIVFNERNGAISGTMKNKKGQSFKVKANGYWD